MALVRALASSGAGPRPGRGQQVQASIDGKGVCGILVLAPKREPVSQDTQRPTWGIPAMWDRVNP